MSSPTALAPVPAPEGVPRSADPDARPPRHRRAPAPRTVLAVSSLGVFIAFVDATIVNIAFPDMARSFPDTSISGLSWVLNAYNIVFAAFLVAAGRIADLLGRRRVFLLGLAVFTLASALCAVAPSAGVLVAFRVVQALGAALLVPASLALVLDAFPVAHRSHAVALIAAVGAVAAGLGPSLGGLLVALSDWRLVFLVNVPVGIVAYALARRHLVESRAPGRRRMPDLLGAVCFALSISALVLGVVKGQDWGWASPQTVGSFVAAVALGALFAWRCTWHRAPLVDLGLLRNRTFSAANATTIVAAAGFFGYTLCNVLFLTGVWGYSVLEAGLAITPGPFVAAAVAGPSSRIAERAGHRVVLVTGGLLWSAAVLWLIVRVGTTPDFVGEWLPATVLLGIGAGITYPNLSGAAVASAPGEQFGTATGLNSVARQVGAALGVAIVVAILGTPTSIPEAADAFDRAWGFAAACLALAGLGCLLVGRVGEEDDTSRTPSLAAAARAVLAVGPPAPAPRPTRHVPAAAPAARETAPAEAPETLGEFLAGVPLFAGLDPELRDAVGERAGTRRVAAGDWLFHAGDPGDALYVVRAGRLEVLLRTDDGEDLGVRVLGRGASLGELSLLSSSPRSASVRAARDTDVIVIAREEFQRLLHEAPALALALTRVLGDQLRASRPIMPEVRPQPATLALVALDAGVPLAALAARLRTALARHGRIGLLDGSETARPEDGTAPASVYGPVLDRAEQGSDQLLLLVPEPFGADPWSAYCLQHADRVLAIGSGASAPVAVGDRPELHGADLVGYDVAVGSGGLAAWAEGLDPPTAHVVRSGAIDRDIERMARRLTGRSLGIVLSGGGARAFSHIGVLEELDAAGITIDRVAGVSMGAFVGAMYASGMDAEEMDAHSYDEWVRGRPLGDYTVPRHALIRGDRAEAMLHRVLGPAAIEELPRSFFSASADLRSGELVVARWGPLADAVALSVCMPVLAPPQVRGGRLLIDGSLKDNLPMDAMALLGEGPMIAVDVKASFERNGAPGDRPREPRAPGLGETLTRVVLLASSNTSETARRHAALTIKPRNEGMGLLEFHQLDRAREAGRQAAREALELAPDVLFG
jgi:NTE family protein